MRGEFEDLSKLDAAEQNAILTEIWTDLKRGEWEMLRADFAPFAHAHQRAPERANSGADWTTWLILGGRGAGKTRAGAEWVRNLAINDPRAQIALIGETEHDAREVMVEGVSGLRAIHRRDQRPQLTSSRRRLEWPNGAVAQLFSAEDPESLRGPQFSAAWLDELAKWRHEDPAAPINRWRAPREPLAAFASFSGFEN